MSKHTPEPWVQWEGTDSIYAGDIIKNTPSVLTGSYVRVADCDMFDNTWEVNAANTKRIVDCVNYCKGVDTDDIEGQSLEADLQKAYDKLKSMYDVLEAATDVICNSAKQYGDSELDAHARMCLEELAKHKKLKEPDDEQPQ